MRKLTYPLLGLIAFLLCWMNLPPILSDKLRNATLQPFGKKGGEKRANELARLELENRTLRSQINHAYEWLLFDQKLTDRNLLQKRGEVLKTRLSEQLFLMPAEVIYRDPSLWSSSLWINVGDETNQTLGKKVVGKNSPVLADGALVGVIEFVGTKQSRVRLITDSGLCPSVRVCRGFTQNRELIHQLDFLHKILEKREDLEKEELISQILALKKKLKIEWEDGYLAKGELHGSSAPFWRSRSPMLKGIGFNFDFPDRPFESLFSEKGGPSRSIKPPFQSSSERFSPSLNHKEVTEPSSQGDKSPPILKEGDLLVTTGLDGVFPPGLFVGTVAKVYPRPRGAFSYEIEVRPTVSHLNDLQTLFVMPPVWN